MIRISKAFVCAALITLISQFANATVLYTLSDGYEREQNPSGSWSYYAATNGLQWPTGAGLLPWTTLTGVGGTGGFGTWPNFVVYKADDNDPTVNLYPSFHQTGYVLFTTPYESTLQVSVRATIYGPNPSIGFGLTVGNTMVLGTPGTFVGYPSTTFDFDGGAMVFPSGTQILFSTNSAGCCGQLTGLDFEVSMVDAPEPVSLALLSLPLTVLVVLHRRRYGCSREALA